MDTVESVKAKIKTKTRELEDLKKMIPRKCGEFVRNISAELWSKIEDLEDEIKRLKNEIPNERM